MTRYYEDVSGEVLISEDYLLTKEEIIGFARVWDPQPFHVSEEQAKEFPMGLIASSAHLFAIALKLGTGPKIQNGLVVMAGLGWDGLRIVNPARPNDVLRLEAVMTSKRNSKSKPELGVVVSDVELKNQENATIMQYTNAALVMKRPA